MQEKRKGSFKINFVNAQFLLPLKRSHGSPHTWIYLQRLSKKKKKKSLHACFVLHFAYVEPPPSLRPKELSRARAHSRRRNVGSFPAYLAIQRSRPRANHAKPKMVRPNGYNTVKWNIDGGISLPNSCRLVSGGQLPAQCQFSFLHMFKMLAHFQSRKHLKRRQF